MMNKVVQENATEQQNKKFFYNFKAAIKTEKNLKASRSQINKDKNAFSKQPVVYYQGENMKKSFNKHLNLRTADRKAPIDTSYHEIPHDHIDYRYECIRSLGKGSFGNVVLAIDHKDGVECAIKVVRRDIRFTTQAKEEIAILEALQKANPDPLSKTDRFPIVKLIEHFMYNDHMCLSFELLGCSLYDLIKDKKDQGLPRDRVRRLMASVLNGLSYIWNTGIIHCDLKPENVLLISIEPDGGPDEIRDYVKIIDFGSSCFIGKQCYPYIQSRFYRAPEVIMRLEYGHPIDIWSFGCLVFEMIRGYPLFPGEDEFDQLACMMEKLGMPPWSMVGPSRVFTRYFTEPETTQKYYNPLDKQTPMKFIPRYPSIFQNADGSAELRPNLSKKTRRLRKPPGVVPVAQAIVSTLSHSSGKYNDYTPSPSEEVDNIHVVKLIEACLIWTPERRINPNIAMTFSWFNYKAFRPNKDRPISLLLRSSRSPNPNDSKQAEGITVFKNDLANGITAPLVPLQAAMAFAPPWIPEVAPPTPPNVLVNQTIPNPASLNNSKAKVSVPSISPQISKNVRKQGSPASISSGENKQEERVIYARSFKNRSPKTSLVDQNSGKQNQSGNLEKKTSDGSLLSLGSSIEDVAPPMTDSLHYTRKNVTQANERNMEPSNHLRKRNQSVEPKRHTQPIENEAIPKRSVLPSRSFITSMTAATSSSPEEESQKSGRHNPNSFTKTSQWDLTALGGRRRNGPNAQARSDAAMARQHITRRSELQTLDRRPGMLKTHSFVDFPSKSPQTNSDDSEWYTRKPIYSGNPKRNELKDSPLERKIIDSNSKSSPQPLKNIQFPKQPITRSFGFRNANGKAMRPHTDYRRRRLPNKSSSTSYLNELSDPKFTNPQAPEVHSSSHALNTNLGGDVEGDNIHFVDLNQVQPTFMKIKQQT